MRVSPVNRNNYPNNKKPSFGLKPTQHFVDGLKAETYLRSHSDIKVMPLIEQLVTELEKQKNTPDGVAVDLFRHVSLGEYESVYEVQFKNVSSPRAISLQSYKGFENFVKGFRTFLSNPDASHECSSDNVIKFFNQQEVPNLVKRIESLN